MRTSRVFHPGQLSVNTEIELDSRAANHLIRVLRHKAGDKVIIFNGDGQDYPATIERVHRHQAWVVVNHCLQNLAESALDIHLLQGISKGDRMDYTLQKAVELGVKRITPVFTERSQVTLKNERLGKKMAHWTGVIVSACEQSGRARVPELCPAQKLDEAYLQYLTPGLNLTLAPEAKNTLREIQRSKNDPVNILIGPEGGLSPDELMLSKQSGFQCIRLGPRILRTETAAVTMISIVQNLWGDLS